MTNPQLVSVISIVAGGLLLLRARAWTAALEGRGRPA